MKERQTGRKKKERKEGQYMGQQGTSETGSMALLCRLV
jgi:hypothetical protein